VVNSILFILFYNTPSTTEIYTPSLHDALPISGRVMDAIPHLKAALPTDDDGSLHYQLAQAYQASGQHGLATKTLAEYETIQRSAAAAREAAKRETEITAP